MTADGRFLLFTSAAVNVAPGQLDDNGNYDVFLWDRGTDSALLLSHTAASTTRTGSSISWGEVLSADGRFALWQSLATLAYAIPLAVGLWALDADWRSGDYWLHPMSEERAAASGEIALIRAAHGPVLCEMQSLCLWAGKPAEADVFNLEQAYLTSARSDADLAQAIAARRYVLIQLEQLDPFPLTPRIRRALLLNYRVLRTGDDGRVMLAPR